VNVTRQILSRWPNELYHYSSFIFRNNARNLG
jgi:hypothetical protein